MIESAERRLPALVRLHRLDGAAELLQRVVGRELQREVDHDAERLAQQRAIRSRVGEARVHVVAEALRARVEAARNEQHGVRRGGRSPAAHVAAVHELIDAREDVLQVHGRRDAPAPATRHRWAPLHVERLRPRSAASVALRDAPEVRLDAAPRRRRARVEQRADRRGDGGVGLGAGFGMKARSKPRPSPFTSPCTTGVNGSPDCARANSVTTPSFSWRMPAVTTTTCRASLGLGAHSTSRGSPNPAPSKPRYCRSARLQRVVERREQAVAQRTEPEHVRRQTERELAAVAAKVAHTPCDATELRRSSRLRRRHRTRGGIDRRRPTRTPDGCRRATARASVAGEVRVHHAGLAQVVRDEPSELDHHLPNLGGPVERRAPAARHVVARIDQRHRWRALGEHAAAEQHTRWEGRSRVEARPVGLWHRGADAREAERAVRQSGGRRRVGEDAGPQQIAELADPAAHVPTGGDRIARRVLARAAAVLAVAIVRVREADARAHVQARRRRARAHAERRLERGVRGGRAREAVGLEPRSVHAC